MEKTMVQRIERQFAGRALTVETGRMARQAAGSCVIQYGETVMLIAAYWLSRTGEAFFYQGF